MTEDRLTRAELAWLLAQEARGAARVLREEVTQLTAPAPSAIVEVRGPAITGSLDALDDAINALSELQQQGPSSRRSRIDVASLVGALAPHARMAFAPGHGTEVFADENDLRRMLQVLLSPAAGVGGSLPSTGTDLEVRGEGDFVRISVPFGPDQSATAEIERRWLSRMAIRLGGRLELAGGEQILYLPTGGASAQHEVDALRRELEQAKQLGETYARELAAVFAADVGPPPEAPAAPPASSAKLEGLRHVGAAIVRRLRPVVEGLHADLTDLRREIDPGSSIPRSLAQRAANIRELVADLDRIATCPLEATTTTIEVAPLCRAVATEAEERSARHGVELKVAAAAAGTIQAPVPALTLLIRSLIDHAIAATPREATVWLEASSTPRGLLLRCRDAGPSVPTRARKDLLLHRVDPTSLGRPAGVWLLVIDAAATVLGATVALDDDPAGGLAVEVRLPTAP